MLWSFGDATPIADYDDSNTDWNDGAAAFGICLEGVGGTGVDVWPTTGSCPASDGTNWRGVPDSPALASAVAATTPSGDGTASFVFGLRTSTSQRAGTYGAAIAMEVVAPG
jgi:hypothetical protein